MSSLVNVTRAWKMLICIGKFTILNLFFWCLNLKVIFICAFTVWTQEGNIIVANLMDIFLQREVKHNLSVTAGACRSESEGHLVVLLESWWFLLWARLADAWFWVTMFFSPAHLPRLGTDTERPGVHGVERHSLFGGDTGRWNSDLLVLPSGYHTFLRCILGLAVVVGKSVCLMWCVCLWPPELT